MCSTTPTWAKIDQGLCNHDAEAAAIIRQRLHPDITAAGNSPDQLVSDGRLAVPIVHVWVINDAGECGVQPMACPLRDGTTPTMGSVDCQHEPLRLAIAAQGPTSRSLNMRMCVDNPALTGSCDRHVPTKPFGARNTLPGVAADFNPVIVQWVQQRLADD